MYPYLQEPLAWGTEALAKGTIAGYPVGRRQDQNFPKWNPSTSQQGKWGCILWGGVGWGSRFLVEEFQQTKIFKEHLKSAHREPRM